MSVDDPPRHFSIINYCTAKGSFAGSRVAGRTGPALPFLLQESRNGARVCANSGAIWGLSKKDRGESKMSNEMYWLVLTVAMTGLFWLPYILDRIMVRGLMPTMANPSPSDKPQSAWAQRMIAAHTNAVENLVVFAPLVLTTQLLNIATPTTAFACGLYFWSRLVHVVVYTLGIPVLRTLAFAGGFVAQALLVLAIFKLI